MKIPVSHGIFKSEVIEGVFAPLIRVFLIGACLFATSVNRVFHISTAGSTSPFKSTIFQSVSFRSLIKELLSYSRYERYSIDLGRCLGTPDFIVQYTKEWSLIAECITPLSTTRWVLFTNTRSIAVLVCSQILVGELINCSRPLAIANYRCLFNLNEAPFFWDKKSILKSPNSTIWDATGSFERDSFNKSINVSEQASGGL